MSVAKSFQYHNAMETIVPPTAETIDRIIYPIHSTHYTYIPIGIIIYCQLIEPCDDVYLILIIAINIPSIIIIQNR